MTSQWFKYLSSPGFIRVVVLQATDLVEEMAQIHLLTGHAAQGLGEATIAALMIASYTKQGERVNLQVQSTDGSVAQAFVDAYPDGKTRGYLIERQSAPEKTPPLWGTAGFLSVLRTKGREGLHPYVGTIPLVSQDLAKDLENYWTQSEQVPSSVSILVRSQGARVLLAGGILVQVVAGASAEEEKLVKNFSSRMDSTTLEKLLTAEDPKALVSELLDLKKFEELERQPLRFECSCSRERVERTLMLAGPAELQDILEREGEARVQCDFCTTEYVISGDELKKLIG